MMSRVIGRLLAVCGWVAWQLTRRVAPLRRFEGRRGVVVLAGAFAIAALVPLIVALAQDQPQDVMVDLDLTQVVTHPADWVRLHGLSVPLQVDPITGGDASAEYGVLVDAQNTLRAIVLQSTETVPEADSTAVTGHLVPATVQTVEVQAGLPIEATVFGAPPEVVSDAIVLLDPAPLPGRVVWWPLTLALAAIAVVLALGASVGYPVFRPAREVDVLAKPLGPGERIPAAVGGRLGDRTIALTDPEEALLLAGRGTHGPVLTIQLMPRGGPAPRPVSIGEGWTQARVGYLHVLRETVPALAIRAEQADVTLLFARRTERDRAAVMVGTVR